MRLFTRLVTWGTGLLLASGFCISAAAQQLPAQNWDPASTDPQYETRKQQAIRPVIVSSEQGRPQQTAPTLARPACFERFDTTASGGWTQVPRGDDNFYGPVNLGWDFSLFGTVYRSVYINTNGNITFGSGLGTYSAIGFPANIPMIAPFWADVDTRGAGSGSIWFKLFSDRLVVVWSRVGYYGTHYDKKNTFQLTIKPNTDANFSGSDVFISYDDMQWSTGDASSGSGGFGGVAATVGANRGVNSDYVQTGRFNLNNSQAPNQPNVGNPGGVNWLDSQCLSYQVRGNTSGGTSNIPPAVAGMPAGNAISVAQGETRTVTLQFSGPETNQTVSVVSTLNNLCNATANTTSNGGSNPTTTFTITGSPCNAGSNTVSFTATDNGPGSAQTTFPLQITVAAPAVTNATWTGALSSDWATAGNWVNSVLPSSTLDAVIPASAPNMPVLSGTGSTAALTVASGASLSVSSTGALTLYGNLTNNGTIGGAGTLLTGGSASQVLGGSANIRMAYVTVGASGAQLSTPLAVSRLLTLNGNLNSGGVLTLTSSSGGTAMVVNNGTATVTGTVTVQRYLDPSLNAGLGYRHFAAPVSNTTVADLATNGFSPVVNADYNTAANPYTVTPFPTVFGYDQSRVVGGGGSIANFDQGWISPASTASAMRPGRGYTVNLAAGQTVDFVGTLGNGPVTISSLAYGSQAESGWQLLGNPYPAPIDWNQVYTNSSGLSNAIHVYKSSGQYSGSYASYVNNVGTNGGSNIIPLGQAFFVRTSAVGGTGTINFTNAARLTSYTAPAMQRTAAEARPILHLSLNGLGVSDQVALYFETGATAGFDAAFDAPKLTGGHNVLLGLSTATGLLAINGLPPLTSLPVTVPLQALVARTGTYTLRTDELANLPAGTTVQLRDILTGALTTLAPLSTYSFTADATATGQRFELIFNPGRITATASAALAAQVTVYPNPAHQQLYLSLPADQQPAEVVLINALGQQVLHRTFPASRSAAAQALSLGQLAPGVYILRATLATGTVTKRVVVE